MSVLINITHDISTDLTDASNYSSSSGEDITIISGAALAGTVNGLNILFNDTTDDFVLKNIPSDASGKTRVRFYYDVNSLSMTNLNSFTMLSLRTSTATTSAVIRQDRTSSTYNIGASLYDSLSNKIDTLLTYTITDDPHYIEMCLTRATTNISFDGSLALYIDDILMETITGVDNYDRYNNFAALLVGATGQDAGSTGNIFIDEIIVNNDGGRIGPYLESNVNIVSNPALGDIYIY